MVNNLDVNTVPANALDVLTNNAANGMGNKSTSLILGDNALPNASNQSTVDATSFQPIQPYVPVIQKYFNEGDVNKAAWTSFWESGGRTSTPEASSEGLFQIESLPGRPDRSLLTDPETNTKYASWMAYGSQGNWQDWNGPTDKSQKADFTPWGDNGALYQGKPFGALSVHHYPGDAGQNLPATPLPLDYSNRLEASSLIIKTANMRHDIVSQAIQDIFNDPANYIQNAPGSELAMQQKIIKDFTSDTNTRTETGQFSGVAVLSPEAKAKVAQLQTELTAAINTGQNETLFQAMLSKAPDAVSQQDTNIKNVDDYIKYWVSQSGNNADTVNTLTDDQKAYLNQTIGHLAPYLNNDGGKKITPVQLAAWLSASQVMPPSISVSIAGMSVDSIKSILTTLPGSNLKLPPGITEESIRAYFSPSFFSSPEAQKQIADIQAQAKPIIANWQNQDNQYNALKIGALDPNNLPILQSRSKNIGQFALGLLSVYGQNIPRQLATFGILGVDKLVNTFGLGGLEAGRAGPLGQVLGTFAAGLDLTTSILDKIGVMTKPDVSQLRSNYYTNLHAGQNFWQAAGNGFDQPWQANGLLKFMALTAADPLTYVGFGVYTPLTEGIPILGPTVAAVERGLGLAFDNPIISKALLTATGAGLGYKITGDYKGALVGGAIGLSPILRGIDLFTGSQLVRNAMYGDRVPGILPNIDKAVTEHNSLMTSVSASAEQVQATIEAGIKAMDNPMTAHLSSEGNAVKGILQAITPWLKSDFFANILATAPAGTARTIIGATTAEEAASRGLLDDATLTQVNHIADMTLGDPNGRGVISNNLAGDLISGVLGLHPDMGPVIADALSERAAERIQALRTLTAGDDPNLIYSSIKNAVQTGLEAQLNDGIARWGTFQGYTIGLMNKLDPIQHMALWKMAATIQNAVTNATLGFIGFGPTHFTETMFRSVMAGHAPELSLSADRVAEAKFYNEANPFFPLGLSNRRNTMQSAMAAVGGDSPISQGLMARDKSLFSSMKDWVKSPGEIFDKVWQNVFASAYSRMVIDEVAKAAPEQYLMMKQAVDKVIQDMSAAGLPTKMLDAYRTDMVNLSFRKDAGTILRSRSTDVPTFERQMALSNAHDAMLQYPHVDLPYINYIDRQLQQGRWGNIGEIINDVRNSMLEHEVAMSSMGEQGLRDLTEKFSQALNPVARPELTPAGRTLAGNRLTSAGPELYHETSVSNAIGFLDRNSIPGSLGGQRIYVSNTPDLALGQGGKGATVVFDSSKVTGNEVRPPGQSPEMAAQAGTNFLTDEAAVGAVKEIRFSPEAVQNDRVVRAIFARMDANGHLLNHDYTLTTEADGTRVLRPKSNQTNLTPDDIKSYLKDLNDASISSKETASSILESATTRAHSISGDASYTQHWDTANKALADYQSTAVTEFTKIINLLRSHLSGMSQNDEVVMTAAMDTLQEKVDRIAATRASSDKVITDFISSNGGRRPVLNSDWQSLIAQRKAIWDAHWAKEAELTEQYNVLAAGIDTSKGLPPTATNGLTVQHLAQFLHSSGDEIAQALVGLKSLTRKDDFIGSIYGSAKGEAIKAGTTPEDLGWTKEALGKLYDDLRIRMGTDPNQSPSLLMAHQQLDSMRQDLEAINIQRGVKPEHVQSVNDAYEQIAQHMDDHPFDQSAITTAQEQARLRYEHTFTDYSHSNVFDSIMQGVFPFWKHQAQRWPWVVNTALSHPGLVSAWGRYQDYTDKGYLHIPGSDIAYNILRGNSLMGGFSGLMTQFPANYESGLLGKAGWAYDHISRAGFIPGFWASLPLQISVPGLGIHRAIDFTLPAKIDSAINAAGWLSDQAGLNLHIIKARDAILPSRYRDYYTSEIAAEMAQSQDFGISGDTLRRHIQSGTATPDEQNLWEAAQNKMAGYSALFEQAGIMKLDPVAKRQAALEYALAIQDITGVSPANQDAITQRLGSSGLRLSDVLPLDPASAQHLQQLSYAKYWAGMSNSLKPSQLQDTTDKLNDFWDKVTSFEDSVRSTGFTKSDGTKVPSLDSLDVAFRSGQMTAAQWKIQTANIQSDVASQIEGIKQSPEFKGLPITLEERVQWAKDHNTTVPTQHPAKELLDLYHGIKLVSKPANATLIDQDGNAYPDPEAGQPNYEDYFATVDGLLAILPPAQRSYLLNFIQTNWTPTQKLYYQANNQYLRPYNNIREGVLDALIPEQQDFIRSHSKYLVDAASIQSLPPNEQQILKDYSTAVGNAETRFRELSPDTEAWLYYWGKTTVLHTEAARQSYNNLVRMYPGPHTADTPIVTPARALTPLPHEEPPTPSVSTINRDLQGRIVSITDANGNTREITRNDQGLIASITERAAAS